MDEDRHAEMELRAVNEQLLLAGLREQELPGRLRRQLAFTGAIVGNLGEGARALDRAGRISFANPAAGRLLGWAEAVRGGSVDDQTPLRAVLAGMTIRTGLRQNWDGASRRGMPLAAWNRPGDDQAAATAAITATQRSW